MWWDTHLASRSQAWSLTFILMCLKSKILMHLTSTNEIAKGLVHGQWLLHRW